MKLEIAQRIRGLADDIGVPLVIGALDGEVAVSYWFRITKDEYEAYRDLQFLKHVICADGEHYFELRGAL